MSNSVQPRSEWTSRKRLAWTIRAATVIVPLVAALLAMMAASRLVPRPRGGTALLGWYALLLAVSWVVSRFVSRAVDRSLPLAALLEMSLTFPESAPSRLGVAQRGSSASMLAKLAVSPPDESAQQAAERILALLTALSAHDRFTRGHAERVRAYADLIAERLELTAGDRDRLQWAALLHDIGKLNVPAALLNKAGKPSAEEWDVLRMHPLAGAAIAAPLMAWLAPMDLVIGEHHERWDGTGYPTGLAGESISFGARIVCVADSFESMTANRAYSRPMKREAALRELVDCAGSQFDPTVVRALLAVPERRLAWAMGPAAWLTGLPLLGQGPVTVVRTAASHGVSMTVGATAVVVAAVAPTSFLGTSAAAAHLAAPPVVVVAATHAASAAPAPTTIVAPRPVQTTTPAPAAAGPRPVAAPTTPAAPTTTASPKPTPKPKPKPAVATKPPRPTTPAPVATPPKPQAVAPVARAVPTTPSPAPTVTKAHHHKPQKPHRPKPAKPPTAAATQAPAPAPSPPVAPPATPPPPPAPPAPPAAPAPPALQCTATYVLTSGDHGNGGEFSAVVTVRNTGTGVVNGWTVSWTYAGHQQIESDDGAHVEQQGPSVTATNLSYNGSGPSGASTSFALAGKRHGGQDVPTLTCVAR